ncbi:2Fe-2S iron-sulfur cluster-binding protein [Streptomyces sp. NBC_01451]|uniref:2Fe-2S iron-sulfur cluster-binding protein n=1 Tax=Streptomyces sp. NBC_01451 TaxID=2903872 RepID=UPI002E2F938C|nr:2Fe-2S iron-sulfur cluster-binding protein [Streptomyces sp. NBC_01451]
MTDDQYGDDQYGDPHGDQRAEGTPRGGGRWDPLPQGDYDDGATAFVKLPEGGIDAFLASVDSPLAAPGHGYVPPQIAAVPGAEDGSPGAPGAWGTPPAPPGGTQWPDPNAVPREAQRHDGFSYDQSSTGQWAFDQGAGAAGAAAPGTAGREVTGEWRIPVAGGDLPDESGEFSTSALVEQWGGTPPATLPGGASAPWATEAPAQPWASGSAPEPDSGRTNGTGATYAPETAHEAAHETAHETGGAGRAGDGTGHQADATGHTATGAGRTVADEDQDPAADAPGPEEGPGGPAEAATESDTAPGPETSPEAAEEPVEGELDANTEASGATATAEVPAAEPDVADPADDTPGPPGEEHPLASYVLRVNGSDRPVPDAWIGESLLYVLRERLGLAGAKDGCSQGECGACNVQVDGRLVASCLVPAVTAAGSEVRTVEGLATDGQPSDVQRALAKCGAVQCGFCVPGMAMTVHDLLEGNPAPTDLETRQALCGNLCRCSGYRGVLEAVREVVAEREAHAADAEGEDGEPRIPHQAGPGGGGVNPSAFDAPGFEPARNHDSHAYDQTHGQDGGQT